MTPPRLVASDLDGTLLRSDGSLSDRSRAAIATVADAGATFVVVTGRPMRWLGDVVDALAGRGAAVVSNGAGVLDLQTGELRRSDCIPPTAGAQIVAELRAAVPGVTFAGERLTGFVREGGYRTMFAESEGIGVAPLEEVTSEPLLKLLVRSQGHDADGLLAACADVLAEGLGTPTHSSREGLVEISAAGVTKAAALERLAGELGVAAADVIAFGDMPNDVSMLRWAGRSWAVANAHPLARDAAGAVTAANDEDGVARIVEELFA